MKRKFFTLLLLAAAVLIIFTACGKSGSEEGLSEEAAEEKAADGYDDDELVDIADEDRLNIGVSLPSQTEYTSKLARELTNRLWRKGFNVILKYASGDQLLQQQQISELLSQDICCLILYPTEETGLDLTEVSAAEIPLINIEVPLEGASPSDIYIGFDNVKAGEQIAEYVINENQLKADRHSTIEMLFGKTDPVSEDIYTGVMNGLSKYFDDGTLVCRSGRTEFDACTTTSENAVAAYNDLNRILSGYYLDQDLDILITGADYIASGATVHFFSQGYTLDKFPIITGANGEPSAVRDFEQGFLSMTSFKDTREEAKLCTKAAVFLTGGKEIDSFSEETIKNGEEEIPSVVLEPEAVDQINYLDELINSEYYTDSEVYE
ncbi:MAG: substrate-binding domain-containing protein [Clostridiales bacterium]|nr:substrate-binding domain-containing protein [Clostridiales bacterium]